MNEKSYTLIANIWNRNLKYCWDFIEKKDKWFFEYTQILWNEYENEKDSLSVNILNSILDKYPIKKIYLIVTNQWFHQDTYYEWLIIKEKLRDKYDVELIEKKDDPRNREKAFVFIEDFFDDNLSRDDNVIISWSGWVPAMKEALNFYAVMKIQNPIILDVDENSESVFSSQVQNEYLKNVDKEKIRWMIENYNYAWALYLLDHSRIKDTDLKKSIEYAKNRFDFLFDKCVDCTVSTISPLPQKDNLLEQIKELLQNIEVSYNRADYATMVAKLYSLLEWICHYIFEEISGWRYNDIEFCKSQWLKVTEWDEEKISNSEYEKYIWNYKKNNRLPDDTFRLWETYRDLKNLKEIRNSSFIAHGFDGINSNEAREMNKKISEIKSLFGIKDNIYNQINTVLLKLL